LRLKNTIRSLRFLKHRPLIAFFLLNYVLTSFHCKWHWKKTGIHSAELPERLLECPTPPDEEFWRVAG